MKGLRGSDVPFMTRRVREPAVGQSRVQGRPGSAQPPSVQPRSSGLDLSPRSAVEPSQSSGPAATEPASVESRLYPAPAFGGLRQLSASSAVVRLNPRQSGIGSLFVTGARGTAWEGEDRTTGAQSVHREQIGTPVPTAGNRPLVSFVNRDAVVVLRHVRMLRRALFIGAGGTMTVQTFDGSAIAVQGTLGPRQRTVLTATRIGALLELRAESVPEEWDDGEIWREFAFTMTVGLGTPRR
ncbi:hypothetical protein GCM10027449_08360 [Sinomonas notoginsengisoli]|uniref:hypothetical protein n=1 Tax=Sinomonas notoginsengisoli TaxID=1457311 RepID=UPI001F1857F3|nr:hypothetical protein [Sinomonas notoginsengisoli]